MIGRAHHSFATSQRFGIRLIRFVFVGAATGLLFAGLVALMVDGLGLRESHAAGLAYIALLPPNFLAHKHSVFRSRQPAWPEVLRYLGMHAVALLSSMGVMAALTGPLGLSHWLGSVAVICVVPLINLALMELWVFPGKTRHMG
ncbi:MAG: GtrA family protein [Rhodobacteraceae bacterium]|nr:GtrA family protein [Paracoccaceae bacterium]